MGDYALQLLKKQLRGASYVCSLRGIKRLASSSSKQRASK
jgi:hypothetical protein